MLNSEFRNTMSILDIKWELLIGTKTVFEAMRLGYIIQDVSLNRKKKSGRAPPIFNDWGEKKKSEKKSK